MVNSIIGQGSHERVIAKRTEDGGQWRILKCSLSVGQLVTNSASPSGWMRITAVEIQERGSPDRMERVCHYLQEPVQTD